MSRGAAGCSQAESATTANNAIQLVERAFNCMPVSFCEEERHVERSARDAGRRSSASACYDCLGWRAGSNRGLSR
jgi:hypothetical protein